MKKYTIIEMDRYDLTRTRAVSDSAESAKSLACHYLQCNEEELDECYSDCYNESADSFSHDGKELALVIYPA